MDGGAFDPVYGRCDRHHRRLRLFDGSPEAKLLVRESHQLLHEIESLFPGSQFVLGQDTMSVRSAMPMFKFFTTGHAPPKPPRQSTPPSTSVLGKKRTVAGEDHTAEAPPRRRSHRPPPPPPTDQQQLRAFVKLVHHSTKLNAWPDVKTVFWLTVGTMVRRSEAYALQVIQQLIPDPAFPRFLLCIQSYPMYGNDADLSLNPVARQEALWQRTAPMCDAVYDVLTTPMAIAPTQEAAAKPSIELSLGDPEPRRDHTPAQMELIERMVDRLLRSPTLQFKIAALAFSNILAVPQLEAAARIVAKCKAGFYQIEQIHTEGEMPWEGYDTTVYRYYELPRAFHDLVLSAFGVDSLPRFWSFQSPSTTLTEIATGPSVLQKISLARKVVPPNIFPKYFSTLRYGCPLEESSTDHWINDRFEEVIHADCWRWLAFGLFYPRPKRFAQAYKLRTLGKLRIDPIGIRTIVNTLRNPVAQLVYNDLEGSDLSAPDCLMVCTVKEDASVEVFVSGAKVEHISPELGRAWSHVKPWHKTLLETSEFEALCEREDGSVCVVVPGAGLGWVAKEDVILLEREPLELARSDQDGWYDLAITTGRVPTHVHELRALFEAIGRQIKSLTFAYTFQEPHFDGPYQFGYTSTDESVMQYIQDQCTNLLHLRLDGAPEREFSALLLALESSHLKTQLLTLNLSNKSMNGSRLEQLASVLARPATPLPLTLQELRVNCHSFSAASIARLHDLLSANSTLQLLEVYYVRPRLVEANPERLDELDCLIAAFQGQVLHSYSPMDVKLAFISAVNEKFATTQGHGRMHRLALPEILLTRVLGFAASIATRRKIMLNPRASS